ncbi:hypothetical protein F2Q70_00002612 [Brassica cretica]|uniref:Phosphofructokinase domain-containing protein n=1 Tax=Brassica cretica TaxID=69181 RepID=A0A8S9IYP1_BRACR|nr:hypothetical protein F2Q70_00002612 [Brassica cretica]
MHDTSLLSPLLPNRLTPKGLLFCVVPRTSCCKGISHIKVKLSLADLSRLFSRSHDSSRAPFPLFCSSDSWFSVLSESLLHFMCRLGFVWLTSSSTSVPGWEPDTSVEADWSHFGECSTGFSFKLFSCFFRIAPVIARSPSDRKSHTVIDLWTDLCKFQYASTIPDCTISLFQSVIKLFQIYEFFDCKYQLAYQRSRSAQPKLSFRSLSESPSISLSLSINPNHFRSQLVPDLSSRTARKQFGPVCVRFQFVPVHIYSEMIGNVMIDARSTGKYYHFVRLMGRAASHITLECALQTHPNITIIGEEVAKIETEKMLIQMVETELEKKKKDGSYKREFMGKSHFFGYEGRCGLPTNFDATYCYALGYGAGSLLQSGKTGLISSGIPLLYVPLEAVMSKYYGESERLLGAVFSQANELSDGAIIFLDEGWAQGKYLTILNYLLLDLACPTEFERFMLDSFDPLDQDDRIWNEAHRDSDQQTWQVPDDEGLDRELYAILPNEVRRKRNMLVYWG